MTRAYATDKIRSIKKTISRFISIVAIVALGSGLFVGLNSVTWKNNPAEITGR